MDHDPSDLKSLILTRIIPKERPHKSLQTAIDPYSGRIEREKMIRLLA